MNRITNLIHYYRLNSLSEKARREYQKGGFKRLITSGIDVTGRKMIPDIAMQHLYNKCFGEVLFRDDLRSGKHSLSNYYYSNSETITIDKPYSPQKVPEKMAAHYGQYEIDRPFVAEIENVKLIGKTAIAVVGKNNDLVLDTSISRLDALEDSLQNRVVDTLQGCIGDYGKKTTFKGPVVPLISFHNHYHHWVFNALPRLEGVSRYEDITGNECTLLIPADPPDWMIQSLEVFGYTRSDCLEWDHRYAQVDHLIIPTIRRLESRNTSSTGEDRYDMRRKIISPSACRYVSGTARSNIKEKNDYSKKIIISRSDVGNRMIENKSEFLDYLEPLGFEQYELAGMSFQEQVELFSKAETIVSPHGQGLTNCIFSDGATVVEIFGEGYIKPTYWFLSEAKGLDYAFLIGSQCNNEKDGNITIDLDLLASIV